MTSVEVVERNDFDKLKVVLVDVVDGLVEATAGVVLEEAKSILEHMDWDARSLVGSGRVQVEGDGVSVRFGGGAGHAAWVEFGRGPGVRPAIDRVVRFLMEKRGIKSERFARRIASKYCARVWREGLPASPFLRPAREKGILFAESAAASLAGRKLESEVGVAV